EVRDSAALIARVIASKSASLRNCCVQLGCLAITSPVALSPVPLRHHQLPLAPPPPELPPPPEKPPPLPPPPPEPPPPPHPPPSAMPPAAGLGPAPSARRVAALVRRFPRETADGQRDEGK